MRHALHERCRRSATQKAWFYDHTLKCAAGLQRKPIAFVAIRWLLCATRLVAMQKAEAVMSQEIKNDSNVESIIDLLYLISDALHLAEDGSGGGLESTLEIRENFVECTVADCYSFGSC
jgi:hypothetical protein